MTTTDREKRLNEEIQRLKAELRQREHAKRPLTHSIRAAFKASIAGYERDLRRS